MRSAGSGEYDRRRASPRATGRPRLAARLVRVAGMIGAVAGFAALAGCGGAEEDPRQAVAETAQEMLAAIYDDPALKDGRILCNRVDRKARRDLQRLGTDLHGELLFDLCAQSIVTTRWRIRPITALSATAAVDLERVTVNGDEASILPAGAGAPLRFRRVGDDWEADLLADPRFRYRSARTHACAAAGRRFGRLRLPTGAVSSAVPYLRAHVAIIRRLERDVAAEPAPADLRARDMRLMRSIRAARGRAERAVHLGRKNALAGVAAVATIEGGDWDPAAQLPGTVMRRLAPITQACMSASTEFANPGATDRIERRCAAMSQQVLALNDVQTPTEYQRVIRRFSSAVGALGRSVEQTTAPAPIAGVHGQTVRELQRMARRTRAILPLLEAGDVEAVDRAGPRIFLSGATVDRGLAQLGYACDLADALPSAPTTPA